MKQIDAQNKILGRIATEISTFLQGKHSPSYVPYKNCGEEVEVINIDKVELSGNKLNSKLYYRHSTYPGSIKSKKMKEFSKAELLKMAVWNMLPKNKLRVLRMKQMIIRESQTDKT